MGAQYLLGRGFHRLLYAGALGSNDEGGEFLFSRERREGFMQEAQAAGEAPSDFRHRLRPGG
jgi:DNA-binding LacI/PurR family transcriptional regulator